MFESVLDDPRLGEESHQAEGTAARAQKAGRGRRPFGSNLPTVATMPAWNRGSPSFPISPSRCGAGYVFSVVTEGRIPVWGGAAIAYIVVLIYVYIYKSGVMGVGWTNPSRELSETRHRLTGLDSNGRLPRWSPHTCPEEEARRLASPAGPKAGLLRLLTGAVETHVLRGRPGGESTVSCSACE